MTAAPGRPPRSTTICKKGDDLSVLGPLRIESCLQLGDACILLADLFLLGLLGAGSSLSGVNDWAGYSGGR
jgi:hypothetical protein